ncbi:uncharacterized protein LOC108102716 isoform X2 [Drosophila eugracilis]|uniref:uncharacterized protein LOC108102716 isoform X2 n=1 Tax=Drosophila eugracilis TaxID=29029 RepID=UPI001BDAFB5C|nr:uncharacterized protein LOC108102716 isoform X2 [Drosophila eugracilis]
MPDLESFSLRLSTCKKLMYIAWLINFILAFADIYVYYTRLKKHMACWGCLFKHYMTLAITFSFLMIPLLILAIPLVYYHVSSHLRIYTTVLFLVTWLQMMLTILFTQEYQVVNDVFRLWLNGQNLEFFEINSAAECWDMETTLWSREGSPTPASRIP